VFTILQGENTPSFNERYHNIPRTSDGDSHKVDGLPTVSGTFDHQFPSAVPNENTDSPREESRLENDGHLASNEFLTEALPSSVPSSEIYRFGEPDAEFSLTYKHRGRPLTQEGSTASVRSQSPILPTVNHFLVPPSDTSIFGYIPDTQPNTEDYEEEPTQPVDEPMIESHKEASGPRAAIDCPRHYDEDIVPDSMEVDKLPSPLIQESMDVDEVDVMVKASQHTTSEVNSTAAPQVEQCPPSPLSSDFGGEQLYARPSGSHDGTDPESSQVQPAVRTRSANDGKRHGSKQSRGSSLESRNAECVSNRVLALWPSNNRYYPGVVESLQKDKDHTYLVSFDDGHVCHLNVENMRKCELADGDLVLLPKSLSVSGRVLATDGDRVWVQCDNGEKRQVQLKDISIPANIIETEWENRRVDVANFISTTTSHRVTRNSKGANAPAKLFESYAFLVTSNDQIAKPIAANGGQVVEWSSLFDLSGSLERGSWTLYSGDSIAWVGDDSKKLVLVSDQPTSTCKYLLALALGIPCIKATWIDNSIVAVSTCVSLVMPTE
jgi:hypothetical protein